MCSPLIDICRNRGAARPTELQQNGCHVSLEWDRDTRPVNAEQNSIPISTAA
jgi:hypothetical protein